ncbi:capsular biosynthesis protein [Brevundimonas halotolerans]|uniref:Capsular polysaccharide export protein n=1 Tax=Brevundimonas halotolerans TaxID=69670 RepID=A0A7W9E6V2_9CAUL|nr:capsular biosynthesis protein [Brevundimonas halotolerans]MBB5660697.1 capsular polysaccharide export protein [Brevundimonas halotolerans]
MRRLILNMGDRFDWRRGGGRTHREPFDAFRTALPDWIEEFTDVIVFGDTSPHARAVLAAARIRGLDTWVLENGYFRPDWITLERTGVNAEGCSPADPEAYANVQAREPRPVPVGRILPWHVTHISLYYFIELIGRRAFPHFRPEYDPPPWRQAFGHVGRALKSRRAATRKRLRTVLKGGLPFVLVCLQRDGDSQLVRHSSLPTNAAFLARVLDSFATHAPPELHLVVKGHPLDAGVIDMEAQTGRLAEACGVSARVHYLDGGTLADLCRASRGLVVNNSSAALSALGFGTPVKVLGQAFFDMEGLTDPRPLDQFWSAPRAPDPDLFARFRTWVIDNTQINGGFHGPAVRRETARAVVQRFALDFRAGPRV